MNISFAGVNETTAELKGLISLHFINHKERDIFVRRTSRAPLGLSRAFGRVMGRLFSPLLRKQAIGLDEPPEANAEEDADRLQSLLDGFELPRPGDRDPMHERGTEHGEAAQKPPHPAVRFLDRCGVSLASGLAPLLRQFVPVPP